MASNVTQSLQHKLTMYTANKSDTTYRTQRENTSERQNTWQTPEPHPWLGRRSNWLCFCDNAEILVDGRSTQTYFVNVCGYWPGLVTGLEVVGSIISTKREKGKKRKTLCVLIIHRDKHPWRQSASMQQVLSRTLMCDFPECRATGKALSLRLTKSLWCFCC